MEERERVVRKIKQGKVEIDYEESSLVVHYDIETVTVAENGRVGEVLDRIPEVRRIKLKNLSADKNMASLANDIVDKCKYIHPSRVEEIEQLLIKLRKHTLANPQSAEFVVETDKEKEKETKGSLDSRIRGGIRQEPERDGIRGRGGGGGGGRVADDFTGGNGNEMEQPTKPIDEDELLPPAHLDELDDYLELLYQVAGTGGKTKDKDDGLTAQIRGTNMIRKLCRVVMNLELLIQNGTVMGALTRVFQEEFKKSTELTFNILRVFLAFSNFMEMHGLMANYRVGLLTMKVIEYEVKRVEHRETEKKTRDTFYENELSSAKRGEKLNQDGTRPTRDDIQQNLERIKKEREKVSKREKKIQKKQDKLLFVAFYILLNLAEDVAVERKMLKKQLLDSLLSMLDHTFADLLVLVVTFLKKTSIFEENKDALKETNIIAKLARFLPCSSQALVVITLRLLFNLSFDAGFREQMIKAGYVPKLVSLLRTPAYRARTLKLLYHLSADDRCKSMITYTDGVPLLMGMVINFPQAVLAKELAALMVNLSHHPRNCEIMISNRGLNHLMDRLSSNKDPLLLKIIRNISQWTFNQQQACESPELQYKQRGLWSPHLKLLMELATRNENHDILVEAFGILANLTVLDLPSTSSWSKLLKDYNLLSLLSKVLVPGMAQADLQLEIVLMISTMASDDKCCQQLASSNIISLLYQLWKEKSEDTEIILQLIHCFHKLMQNESSREEALYSTRIVVDIIDCLGHSNLAVRDAADKATELVLEYDRKITGEMGSLGLQIRKKRFESHNQAWLASEPYSHSLIPGADMGRRGSGHGYGNADGSGPGGAGARARSTGNYNNSQLSRNRSQGGDYIVGEDYHPTDNGGVIHMNHRATTEHGDMGYEGKHNGGDYEERGRLRHGGNGGDEEEYDGPIRRHSYDYNAMGMQESSDLDYGYSDGEGEDSGEGYGRGGGMMGRK